MRAAAKSPGARILVVDDEASLRDVLGKILSAEGYDVRNAGNGREALDRLAAGRFDFLLCDLRMPVMGGLELLREITARGIPGTVIMMSAFGTVETAVEAMKLGAYDYVSKPFMSDEILLTLRKAAERERLREENEAARRRQYRFPLEVRLDLVRARGHSDRAHESVEADLHAREVGGRRVSARQVPAHDERIGEYVA